MIPFSFSWDTRDRKAGFKWDGLFNLKWSRGKISVCGIPVPFSPGVKKSRFPFRWAYVKEVLLFLRAWKLKEMEGSLSFPDPMVNGILYGFASAIGAGWRKRGWDLSINFLGQNWCRGETTVSPGLFLRHLLRFMLARKREGGHRLTKPILSHLKGKRRKPDGNDRFD